MIENQFQSSIRLFSNQIRNCICRAHRSSLLVVECVNIAAPPTKSDACRRVGNNGLTTLLFSFTAISLYLRNEIKQSVIFTMLTSCPAEKCTQVSLFISRVERLFCPLSLYFFGYYNVSFSLNEKLKLHGANSPAR